ncbi:efflux RND transporter periplasmic adaptor subunit [Tenacibaculum dicentrarchi]|uniref:efflux RND transporter periplasmic adaptor subunit n=1 Tax=Tenacibaculum dicentrarchi TaxID=669041 RepID=UPI003516A0AB
MKNIFLVLLIFSTLFSCKKEQKKQIEIIRPIKYITIGKSNTELTRTFSGLVKASNEIELSFRSSGVITKLNVKVGKKVKKGDLIAKLDNIQANLAYEQTLSALNSAKSTLKTSKSQLERTRSLYEKGSNSLSDYEQAKNVYQTNLDQLETAKRNIGIKKSQIAYGYIYAPKNGIIASKNVSINETANSGQVIAVLNAGEGLNVEIGLPESIINKVALNMETILSFSALEGISFEGNITEIAPVIDVNSATYPIKIALHGDTQKLKQGMTASVTFNFNKEEVKTNKQIIVPVKTVGEDGKGNFVFIVNTADKKIGTVKKQHITLGKITNNGFTVLDGLKKGQLLVTAGTNSLLDGQKVKL